MKRIVFVVGMVGIFSGLVGQVSLETQKDSISYAIGYDIGQNITQGGIPLNADKMAEGLKHALDSAETVALTGEEVAALIQVWQTQAQQNAMERMAKEAEANQAAGEAFLADNATKDSIQTTDSGLQYQIIKAGEGESPTDTSEVTVHYEGKLIDGTTFDSSYERGEPITFTVGQVIPGWTEALKLMRPGGKWKVFVPSDLGYGERGTRDGTIGPNAILIFDMELLSVD